MNFSLFLFLEQGFKKSRSLQSKIDLIKLHNNFSDIEEIIKYLPSEYIIPLISGIESQIREEIREAKKKNKIETRRIENKNLDVIFLARNNTSTP